MRLNFLIVLFIPLVSARTIPKSSTVLQETFLNTTPGLHKEKVPGYNPMYFTRVKRADQLFGILDLEVSPYPLVRYETYFFPSFGS